jgi:hypothetical protein
MAPKNIWYLIIKDYELMNASHSFKNDVMGLFIGKAEGNFVANFDEGFLSKSIKHILSVLEELKRELVINDDKNVKDSYKTLIILLENLILIRKEKYKMNGK